MENIDASRHHHRNGKLPREGTNPGVIRSVESATIGLWATNIGRPLTNLSDWVGVVSARMAEAAAQGAYSGMTSRSAP